MSPCKKDPELEITPNLGRSGGPSNDQVSAEIRHNLRNQNLVNVMMFSMHISFSFISSFGPYFIASHHSTCTRYWSLDP